MTPLFVALVLLANPIAVHDRAIEFSAQRDFAHAALICRAALRFQDPSSLGAALLLRDLSHAWRGEGYLEKALAARQQELAILQLRLGEHDANIALALDGIGEIYFEQHRFTAARKSFEAALRVAEESLDPDSPHLSVIRNDLIAASCGAGLSGPGAKAPAKIKSSCPPIPPLSAKAKN